MPLYFFDIIDGGSQRDDVGTECATREDVRQAAMEALPEVAKDQIPKDRERRTFTIIARSEGGEAIYTASLSFSGIWLDRRPGDPS